MRPPTTCYWGLHRHRPYPVELDASLAIAMYGPSRGTPDMETYRHDLNHRAGMVTHASSLIHTMLFVIPPRELHRHRPFSCAQAVHQDRHFLCGCKPTVTKYGLACGTHDKDVPPPGMHSIS